MEKQKLIEPAARFVSLDLSPPGFTMHHLPPSRHSALGDFLEGSAVCRHDVADGSRDFEVQAPHFGQPCLATLCRRNSEDIIETGSLIK